MEDVRPMPERRAAAPCWGPGTWFWAWLVSVAAGAPGLAAGAAAGMAAHSFLHLWQKDTARARLECGLALPLLLLTGGGALAVAAWLAAAGLAASFRECGWVARLASFLTIVFPALLLLASRVYLDWLGYGWPLP